MKQDHGKNRKGMVLIVDDEESVRYTVEAILDSYGFESISTTDPQEGLRIFQEDPDKFDLVMVDQTMPFMTGVVFIEKIRKTKSTIPAVLLSGYQNLEKELSALDKTAFTGFLGKPFRKNELLEIVNKALKQQDQFHSD